MPPSAAPPIPPDLKPIAPYLARAQELASAEPVISYWCTYYALQQAMSIGSQDSESQTFLFGLMDKLEALKAENSTNDAFTDDAAASAYVENFGLKLFSQADNEDRKGKATRLTARKFLAAANFLELLSIFGDAGADNRDKIKYAKWKAADIAKAFREGRTPVPGPAGGLSAEEERAPETSRVTADEEKELSKELAALGTGRAEEVGSAATSPALSTSASASAAAEQNEPSDYPFPQQPTALPPAPSAPDFIDDEPDFTDTAPPTSSAAAAFEYDPSPSSDISHAATPVIPSFLDTPAPHSPAPPSLPPPPPAAPTPQIPQTHQTSTLHPPSTHLPSEPPAFPSAVFPPPQQPPVPVRAAEENYDPMTVAKVQKHARWAISALDYEDWETARKELRNALAMLGG